MSPTAQQFPFSPILHVVLPIGRALETLRKYRFEFYLATLGLILFGDLVFAPGNLERDLTPFFLILNSLAGYILISKRKRTRIVYGILFLLALLINLLWLHPVLSGSVDFRLLRLTVIALFYCVVTAEIILQVWQTGEVDKDVIFGVMGGYVSLGILSFFLLLGVVLVEPDAFRGLVTADGELFADQLLYYAYITLMTIGYGDIVPITPLARKAAVLIGLWGQFYLVIITAVVVGKYISGQKKEG